MILLWKPLQHSWLHYLIPLRLSKFFKPSLETAAKVQLFNLLPPILNFGRAEFNSNNGMEFRAPSKEYSDDDEEVLSLCDLVTEGGVDETAVRDSNTGSLDLEGFVFDFCCGGFTTDNFFPADDIFRHGRLLPLALQRCRNESLKYTSVENSNSANLLTWRNDLLDSESTFSSISRSTSSSSQRKIQSGEILPLRNSKSKGNHKPPAPGRKMSGKWPVLSLGLMKPPPMKLEDLRLRQGKTRNNNMNLDLRRSVSCNYYKDLKLEEKEAETVNFEEKRRSVKERVVVKKTAWLNGWKTSARFPSFNSCKTSSTDVVDNGRLQKACKIVV